MGTKAPAASAALALLAVLLPGWVRAQPQPAAAASSVQPAATDFQLSPLHGQDDVQQWFDRHECDSQARRQSGYDPTGRKDQASQPAAREEYLRAMAACLTGRGYEVRYAPPQPPPPPAPVYTLPPEPPRARELRYRALSVEAGGGYSVTPGSTADYVHSAANAVAALNWFPDAALPLGIRMQGSYTWLRPASRLFALNNVGYNRGQQDLYGGDVDLRLNLLRAPSRQQLYLAAGSGWYRMDTSLQKISGERVCGPHFCGVFPTLLAQEHDLSPWESSWNAGLGWEIALDTRTAFFVEVRYQHLHPYHGESQLVPISLGLRF
jgi:hypothetical protein